MSSYCFGKNNGRQLDIFGNGIYLTRKEQFPSKKFHVDILSHCKSSSSHVRIFLSISHYKQQQYQQQQYLTQFVCHNFKIRNMYKESCFVWSFLYLSTLTSFSEFGPRKDLSFFKYLFSIYSHNLIQTFWDYLYYSSTEANNNSK